MNMLNLWGKSSKIMRYRLSVTSRLLAAILGGYLLAAAIELLLILIVPLRHEAPFSDRRFSAQIMIYAIHIGILLWIFHVRSATRAWIYLISLTAVVYALCWVLLQQWKTVV